MLIHNHGNLVELLLKCGFFSFNGTSCGVVSKSDFINDAKVINISERWTGYDPR